MVNVPFFSHRSLINCYYPLGSIEHDGKFELVTSSTGCEELTNKYQKVVGKDVLANDIINYWRVEPLRDSKTNEIKGSRICNLNMFDPKGFIPGFALKIITSFAESPVQQLSLIHI